MQGRPVAVCQPRTFVEVPAGQFAQPVKMRLDMAEERVGQMDVQEIGQRRIGTMEIHAGGVGREQTALARPWRHIRLEELAHFR